MHVPYLFVDPIVRNHSYSKDTIIKYIYRYNPNDMGHT